MRIAFLLFPNVTQLDLTGPAQFLSRLPDAKVDLVWDSLDPVPTDAGFSILPTATFAEVPKADLLCVPGGIGVSKVIDHAPALDWVRRVGADAQWVTSVCTGALILGAAGLLKGYKATTHWAWHDLLSLFGAEPVQARHVIDRNRATGGGVTAGIDFALALMAEIAGEDHARAVQLALEYDPAPPFDGGSPAKAGQALVDVYTARANRLAPSRREDLIAAAQRLGFQSC
ncbi:DJ-1/PfpI family protein [Novosphingobium ginsenosidimutans]|uniref:DJ-1/PfpI family protein n=1 Tax=Novosphingobium ginsenosidimutans TaxID=1176536 RepID=A0A5B8S1H5_9SPHN|nr:DJ-1/PfpI family protein [Novosphingobium ginsenosidimutans]QEA15173.1 DJ-1/PfpI family protein [Novosphingobium ginsenosidimutans]